MAVSRARIEAAFGTLWRCIDAGDWTGFVDCFAEGCSFVNSVLTEPIRGREALRAATAAWPRVTNRPEWHVIEGDRLVVGWKERQEGMPADAPPYRGISTYRFDDDGLVREYEGIFDTAALRAAWGE